MVEGKWCRIVCSNDVAGIRHEIMLAACDIGGGIEYRLDDGRLVAGIGAVAAAEDEILLAEDYINRASEGCRDGDDATKS
jgi:hypothetical protein